MNIHLFNEKLREWEDYNYRRPHGALNGQTPLRAADGENES
jgi:transposase InsO family protein